MDGNDRMAADSSPRDAQTSSSMQPFFMHSDSDAQAQASMEVTVGMLLHMYRRAPSMLPIHPDRALRDRVLFTSLRARDPDAGDDHDDISAYGDGGFGAVPASGVAMACLPERTVGESEAMNKAECAVCMEAYEAGDALRTMPCLHRFHENCIFGWLRVSRLCPLCRFALPAETEEEDDEGE